MASSCKAVCQILSGSSSIGILTLTQEGDQVKIEGNLANLTPGKHGISANVSGDLSNGPNSCGPVFNPFGKTHGAPQDDQRMVGDLGNITANADGTAEVSITDSVVKLIGPHSILGRSLVIYAGEDDGGRGGHEASLSTGNPGPRAAAGVIGLSA